MRRRNFVAGLVGPFVLRAGSAWGFPPDQAPPVGAVPTAAQLAWLELEIGMFVHLAPNTWQDAEYDDRSIPAEKLPFAADAAQWADTAVALGARYIVLVAKHVGGFCLWQTDTSTYSVRQTAWKGGHGDVMADLRAACDARGLGLGVYLSPRDDAHGAGLSGQTARPEAQEAFNRIARQQLLELTSRYGPLTEIWFDGSSVVPVADILSRHGQNAMIFQGPQATIRWVGNEDGFAPDPVWNALGRADAATGMATAMHGDPRGDAWMPLEVDVSIRRPSCFWSTTNESNLLTVDQLVEIYYRSVGRGAQLLLNLPPDRNGRIPEVDAARARAFGDEIRRRFAQPSASTSGGGTTVTLDLAHRGPVDHLVLKEDLRGGQRILSYRLEGLRDGFWQQLGEGTSVGRARIHPIRPREYQAVRVSFPASLGRPEVAAFQAYRTNAAPPASWQQPAQVWADDVVGSWETQGFDLDLTPKIIAAAQYRVRFVGRGTGTPNPRNVELLVNGTPRPGVIRADPARLDLLTLTITGLGQQIRLRGVVDGVPAGTVLLRRL